VFKRVAPCASVRLLSEGRVLTRPLGMLEKKGLQPLKSLCGNSVLDLQARALTDTAAIMSWLMVRLRSPQEPRPTRIFELSQKLYLWRRARLLPFEARAFDGARGVTMASASISTNISGETNAAT
jgi:hypothetical protein